jgi:hypothetical protein
MNSVSPPSKTNLKFIIRDVIFFLGFFLYIWLGINPALYNQRHDPVFLLDSGFFRGFMNYAGGPLDYFAALLSQLYYFPILGALLITVLIWGITLLTAALIRIIRPGQAVQFVQYIPAVLLLILHSHYKHPLAASLGLILSLVFVLIHLQAAKDSLSRLITYCILGLVIYYTAAGQFLFFALLCTLYESFYLKRPLVGGIYILLAMVIPYLAKEFLFLINYQMAYLHLLPFEESYTPGFTPHLLILFYFFLFIFYHPAIWDRLAFLKRWKFKKIWLQFSWQTALLFLISGFAAIYAFEKNNHLLLLVDYYARHERWQDIINVSKGESSDLLQVAFYRNRALFHTGQLLENMFAFPQNHAIAGLLLPKSFGDTAPLQQSDFFYELGSINESRHWAYEAFSTDGETPWILKRMVEVNLVSGDMRAAERSLNVLQKTLFFRNRVQQFRKILRNPDLAVQDEILNHGRSMLVKTDFLVGGGNPLKELDNLLEENPKNRMAFEYRIAHELLICLLGNLPKHIALLHNFGYTRIPRHIEEALFIMWMMSKRTETPPIFDYIRPETKKRFNDFNKVLAKYRGDRGAAQTELREKFGDTYWYYMFYNNPLQRRVAQEAAKRGGIE